MYLNTLTPLPHTPANMSSRSMPNKKATLEAAKAKFKAGPHASVDTPKPKQAPAPIDVDSDDDSSDEEDEKEEKAVVDMDDEDDEDEVNPVEMPSMVFQSTAPKKKPVPNARAPISFQRVVTDAPFHVNGVLFQKSAQYRTMAFAISPADADYINKDLVENFNINAALVKYDESIGSWLLRGKPQGAVDLAFNTIPANGGYTIVYNIGEWANAQTLEFGVSAQIIDLLDSKGNSTVKVSMKFPEGTTYSAGRRITAEEAAELKKNKQ